MTITKIHYNWHQIGEASGECCEDYHFAEIGKKSIHGNGKIVVEITEVRPRHEADKTYFFVKYEDQSGIRIYNPNIVFES